MKRFLKITVLSAAVAVTVLTALAPAEAHDRWRHRHDGGAIVAAGVVGLALGAIAAGALSEPEPVYRPVYDERRPVARPRPVRPYAETIRYQSLEPWSPDWFRYCEDRYRTFDPRTGTFVGYDGQEHFCVAN